MGIGRYTFSPRVVGSKGKVIVNRRITSKIFNAVVAGSIPAIFSKLTESQRLDVIAAQQYGDPSYWWVIAAASGIGWGLQCPPGTILRIPTNLAKVLAYAR